MLKLSAQNKLQIKLIIIYLLTFSLSALASYILLSIAKIQFKKEGVANDQPEASEAQPDSLAPYGIVLLGYGGAGHEGGGLTDAINVIYLDPKKKQIAIIAIPRDIWVEIPVRSDIKETHKINFAFAIGNDDNKYPLKEPQYTGEHGGGEMAKVLVSKVIGIPIKYYVAVSFDNFKKVIDSLNGIEVVVKTGFDDYFYPIAGKENESCGKSGAEIASLSATLSGFILEKQFTCRYEHLHFDAGAQTMDGEAALKFVRSRHSEQHGGDYARGERQQVVLNGIKNKLLTLDALSNPDQLFEQLIGLVQTDVDLSVIKTAIEAYGQPQEYSITKINLSADNVFKESFSGDKQFILVPKEGFENWQAVHKFIQDQLISR